MRRHLHTLLLPILALLLAVACGRDDNAPPAGAPAPVEQVDTSAAGTASINGEIGVPADVDPVGIMVFAEGTSHVAFTDGEGRYLLSGLPQGEYRIRAARADLQSLFIDTVDVTPVDIRADQPFRTLLRVLMDAPEASSSRGGTATRFGSIRGTVATPFPGEEDGVRIVIDGTPYRTVTVPGGSYEFPTVPAGVYTLRFQRQGYRDATAVVSVEPGREATVDPVRLRLGRDDPSATGATIFGTVDVLTADGTPLSDYSTVRVILEGTRYLVTPDDNGRFQFNDLPPDSYIVAASAPGFLLDRRFQVNLANVPAVELTLTLVEDTTIPDDAAGVFGRALLSDAGEAGHAGITVAVAGTNLLASTNAAGEFQFLSLPPGTYDLVASFNGYLTTYANGVDVSPGAVTEVADIVLEPDIERPRVVFSSIDDGESNLPIRQPTDILLQFSQEMEINSVIEAIDITPAVTFRVRTGGRGRGGATGDVYTIEMQAIPGPDNDPVLTYDTRYTLTVASTAASRDGITMEEPYRLRFTTGAARIVGTSPRDGARDAGVYPDQPVLVYFNAPIDEDSFSPDDVDIDPETSPSVQIRRDFDTGWSVIEIGFGMQQDTDYEIRIRRGARTIAGSRVENLPYAFSFRTREWKDAGDVYDINTDRDRRDEERERQRRR